MPKFNLGWLKDKNGEKFAPKTFTTQVLDDTGRKNLNEILDNKIDSPTIAKVGQLLEVEDVDSNGKPIKWRAIDASNNQTQVDWNQNDSSQLDYVKNRPFYSELTNKLELLPLSNYEFEYGGYYYWHWIINSNENATTENHYIKPNTEYEVNWKGNIYKLKSKTYVDKDNITYTYVGNIYYTYNIIHPQPNQKDWDTGEPFLFASYGDRCSLVISCKNQELVDGRILLSLHEYSDKDEYEGVGRYLDEKYIPNNIPKIESATVGQLLVVLGVDENGKPISFGAVDNDFAKTSDLSSYVKSTQYATSSKAGLVRTNTSYGTTMSGQYIQISPATTSNISAKTDNYKPLTSKNIDYIVKEGLGDSALTWTESEKTKARKVIGAISASDIPEIEPQVQADYGETNSFSASYIKNKTHYDTRRTIEINEKITRGGFNAYGDITADLYDLLITNNVEGLLIDGKSIYLNNEDSYGDIEYRINDGFLLRADKTRQRAYVWDNYSSDGSISGYLQVTGKTNGGSLKQLDEKYIPDNIPKIATATIGQTLEVESVDEDGKPTKWKAVDKSAGGDVDLDGYVKNTDYATKDKGGVARIYSSGDVNVPGVGLSGNGILGIVAATNANIDSKTTTKPITPTNLDYAVKSGLTTNSLEWTAEEKQAARELIGAGTGDGSGEGGNVFIDEDGYLVCGDEAGGASLDVQIDGTSIVEDGVANIPIATKPDELGLAKYNDYYGIAVANNSYPYIVKANSGRIDKRIGGFFPIVADDTLDYAVKAAMCDGVGAEWTEEEKKSARERMGASSASVGKFIGEVTIDNDETRIVEWTECADGSPLDFDELFIMAEGTADSTRNLCFTTNNEYTSSAYQWSVEIPTGFIENTKRYITCHSRLIGDKWFNLGCTMNTTINGSNSLRNYPATTSKGTQRCTTSLIVGIGWGHFTNGTKIAVWGR